MKWLFSIFTVFVFSSTLNAQPIKPVASASMLTASRQIAFQLSWTQRDAVDSTMVAVFLSTDTLPVLYRRTRSPDTIRFTIPDDTTTYRFLLVNVRRNIVSPPANVNFYFNANEYYKLIKLHVRPKDVKVEVGGTMQFCAFMEYNDGSIVMRDRDKTIPTCITEYEKFDTPLRKSIGARLRNANTVCLQWQTTGGNIVNESCSNP